MSETQDVPPLERPELTQADLEVSDAEWIDDTDNESEISEEPTTSDDEFICDDDESICESDSDWEVEPVVLNVTVTTRRARRTHH